VNSSEPYSNEDLAKIIQVLEQANTGGDIGDRAVIAEQLQCFAFEYLQSRDSEAQGRARDPRKDLQFLAAVDWDSMPSSIRQALIPPLLATRREFKPMLRALNQIRRHAATVLKSLPKRGPLGKQARFFFVDNLAGLYEEVTQRRAAKVGKETEAKPSPRNPLGYFYRFVVAAFEPVDRAATAGISRVIDKVIDMRRKQGRDATQSPMFSD
jgi:hypothetical protein